MSEALSMAKWIAIDIWWKGWYEKDDEKKTMLLYGSFGDYGEPRLDFLNRIPSELKGYKFLYSHDWGKTSSELDVSGVEWI